MEKAGKFRLELYSMRDGAGDGPMIPTRINKYDFSDPIVIEVKFIFFDFYLIQNEYLESKKSSTKRSINTSSSSCINICCNTSSIINITNTFIIISSSNSIFTCLE
jgi:hypothetical protein